jgi:hypothetical protein
VKRTVPILVTIIVILLAVSIVFGYQYFSNQPHVGTQPFFQSISGYYLPLQSAPQQGNESKIFVVSANASYGNYPFHTVTTGPYQNPPTIIAKHGEPCVIINVTLRNDYSSQNPGPYHYSNSSTWVYVRLSAKLFSGTSQITAKDITNAASAGTTEALVSFKYGQTETVSIYMATDNTKITSFQLAPGYIGELLPP